MRTSTSKMRSTACRRSPGLGSQNRPNMGGGTRANAAGPAAGTGPSMAAHAAGSSTATARSAWRRFMDSLCHQGESGGSSVRTALFRQVIQGKRGRKHKPRPRAPTTPTGRYLYSHCAVPTLDWLSTAKKMGHKSTSSPRLPCRWMYQPLFLYYSSLILRIDDSCSCV